MNARNSEYELLSARTAYDKMKDSQREIGVEKIRLGALLWLIKHSEEWRGRCGVESFQSFLREENIEPHAARQYMFVAEAFVIRLRKTKLDLLMIGHVSMRVMVVAARVVTKENYDEVIDMIIAQPRPEAIEDLMKKFGKNDVDAGSGRGTARVNAIVSRVNDLTHDQRFELYQRLGARGHATH